MSTLVSIQVAMPAPLAVIRADGPPETVRSAIVKRPVSTAASPARIALRPLGLEGDAQADLTVHGGLEKAVYVYPAEHYAFWRARLGRDLPNGSLGENLTVTGLDESALWIGDRLHIGETELRVESPRQPCFKLAAVLADSGALKAMTQSGLCGWYLSVVTPGAIAAGDAISVTPGPREETVAARFAVVMRRRRVD